MAPRPSIQLLLLVGSMALMINGIHAQYDQSKGFQSWYSVWELISHHAITAAAAATLLLGFLTFGGRLEVARWMTSIYRRWAPIPRAIPEHVPEIPEAVPALPIYPAVQGNNPNQVLANAPLATRLNSPLAWLDAI